MFEGENYDHWEYPEMDYFYYINVVQLILIFSFNIIDNIIIYMLNNFFFLYDTYIFFF